MPLNNDGAEVLLSQREAEGHRKRKAVDDLLGKDEHVGRLTVIQTSTEAVSKAMGWGWGFF